MWRISSNGPGETAIHVTPSDIANAISASLLRHCLHRGDLLARRAATEYAGDPPASIWPTGGSQRVCLHSCGLLSSTGTSKLPSRMACLRLATACLTDLGSFDSHL